MSNRTGTQAPASSRTQSQSQTQPAAAQQSGTQAIPHERIAMRAYDKWLKSGCKDGNDQQHWLDAEKELRAETQRLQGSNPRR